MNAKKTIKQILNYRGWTQARLAEEAGFCPEGSMVEKQGRVSSILNRGSADMRTDQLVKLATALGCEVVVRDKYNPSAEWIITAEEKEAQS